MSLLYLYRFKFAVKWQIILFENAIIGHFAIRAVSGQLILALLLGNPLGLLGLLQGEGREGVETPIHRASPSVMRASRGVRRSNCKQIWLRVHDPSEGMLKLLLYKILLV